MEPKENFQAWSALFMASFETKEYQPFLSKSTELIKQILQHSDLQDQLKDQTECFLKNVILDAVDRVLNISYVLTETNLVIDFLSSAAQLIQWAAIHNDFKYSKKLLPILNGEKTIYVINQTQKVLQSVATKYEEICDNFLYQFISNHINQNITEAESKSESKTLEIEHFEILFHSFLMIDQNQNSEIKYYQKFFNIVPHFIKFMNNDSIRTLNSNSLKKAFQSLVSLMINHPEYSSMNNRFCQILNIAKQLVQSNMVQKALIGAAAINVCANATNEHISNEFDQFLINSNLANFLVTANLHPQLLEQIKCVIPKILSSDNLKLFLNKAISTNSSEQATILSIISQSLTKFNIDVFKSFIEEIKLMKFLPPELLIFLSNLAKSFAEMKEGNLDDYIGLSLSIFDLLINYGEGVENTDGVVTALSTFAQMTKHQQIKEKIESTLSTKFGENRSKQPFYIAVLHSLINHTYQFGTNFSQPFLSSLIDITKIKISETESSSDLFALLSLLLIKTRGKADKQIIQSLTHKGVASIFWKFLTDLILGLGTDAYDENTSNEIHSILKTIDFVNESTNQFLTFVESFILVSNLRDKKLISQNKHEYSQPLIEKKIPKSYVFTSFPPNELNLLFKVIMLTKDSDVLSNARAVLFSFIEKSQSKTPISIMEMFMKVFTQTSTIIREYFAGQLNHNDDIDQQKESIEYLAQTRILQLILDYLDISEKDSYFDDYGVSRHKEKTVAVKKLSAPDSITLKVVYAKNSFSITTNLSVSPESLRNRICRKLRISGLDIVYNNYSLLSFQTLALSRITNNATICCKETNMLGQYIASEDLSLITMPSMVLYQNNFSKPMLEILGKKASNENSKQKLLYLQKTAYEILKRLPSDIDIKNEVNTIGEFCSKMEKSIDNLELFLYRLHILFNLFKEKTSLLTLFVQYGGINLLGNYLLNHQPPFHGLTLLLNTLNRLFATHYNCSSLGYFSGHNLEENEQQIIIYLIGLFNIADSKPLVKKSLKAALDFINLFLSINSQETLEVIFEHVDLLEQVITNFEVSTNEKRQIFSKFVSFLKDNNQFFDLSVRMINKQIYNGSAIKEISPNLISIIRVASNDIDDLANTKKKSLLDSCWKVILTQNTLTKPEQLQIPVPTNTERLHGGVPLNENHSGQLSAICQIILSILNQAEELKQNEIDNTDHLARLLRLALLTDDSDLQENMFQLCSFLLPENSAPTIPILNKAFTAISATCWNYQPLNFAKSSTGFAGLRNLGSTCYMNSILQQLFFTFPFRYLICLCNMKPIANNENDWYQQLKELFLKLLLTKRSFCDTQAFCTTKRRDQHAINPRQQQDSLEFFQSLLNQLPPQFHSPFKGEIENTIEGITEDFKSFNYEEFYAICLEIRNNPNVQESLKSFFKSEKLTNDNQYAIAKDHKIDAEKYVRIKTAPDILVLQLKRFEYNLITNQRIKVNDQYTFEDQINISPFMVDSESLNNDQFEYELTGVVVHSGNAQCGHYFSIIRIDGQWIKFNDCEVSEISQLDFQRQTYGGQNDEDFEEVALASAYLLFYQRVNSTYEIDLPKSLFKTRIYHSTPQNTELADNSVKLTKTDAEASNPSESENIQPVKNETTYINSNSTENSSSNEFDSTQNENDSKEDMIHITLRYDQPFDITYLLNPAFLASIEQDNLKFSEIQAVFSESTFNFISFLRNISDLTCLLPYFFNIFCHSSLSHFIDTIYKQITNNLTTKKDYEFSFDFLSTNFHKSVQSNYLFCSNAEILRVITELIQKILSYFSDDKVFSFVDKFFSSLVFAMKSSWKQIPFISELILSHSTPYAEQKYNWSKKLVHFVMLVYDPTQPNCLLSNDDTTLSTTNNRSVTMLQNINLSNIFKASEKLFEYSNNRNDYQILLKYSSSILQSRSNFDSYSKLLAKMLAEGLVDLKYLIKLLSSFYNKESNEQLFSDLIYRGLISAEKEKIERIINEIIPSFSVQFTQFLIQLIQKRDQTAIRFLINNSRETLIIPLTSSNLETRKNTQTIIYQIFNKNTGKPTQTPKAYSSSASDNCNPVGPHVELDSEDYESMTTLLPKFNEFIYHLGNNMDRFYNPDQPHSIDAFYSIQILQVFDWMLFNLKLSDVASFQAVQNLFHFCAISKQNCYYVIAECIKILRRFPIAQQREVFQQNYRNLMEQHSSHISFSGIYTLFLPYLEKGCCPEDLRLILLHKSCIDLLKDLRTIKSNDKSRKLFSFINLLYKFINNTERFPEDSQNELSKLTLQQLIYYRLKLFFYTEVLDEPFIFYSEYRELILICYRYFNAYTREYLLQKLASHLVMNKKGVHDRPDPYFGRCVSLILGIIQSIKNDKSGIFHLKIELPPLPKQSSCEDPFDYTEKRSQIVQMKSPWFNLSSIPEILTFVNYGVNDPATMNYPSLYINAAHFFEAMFYYPNDDLKFSNFQTFFIIINTYDAESRLMSIIDLFRKTPSFNQDFVSKFQDIAYQELLSSHNSKAISRVVNVHLFNTDFARHIRIGIDLLFIVIRYNIIAKRICEKFNFTDGLNFGEFNTNSPAQIGEYYTKHFLVLYDKIRKHDDPYLFKVFYEQLTWHFSNRNKREIREEDPATYINYLTNDENEWVVPFIKKTICNYPFPQSLPEFYRKSLQTLSDEDVIDIFKQFAQHVQIETKPFMKFEPVLGALHIVAEFSSAKPHLRSQFLNMFPIKLNDIRDMVESSALEQVFSELRSHSHGENGENNQSDSSELIYIF